MRYNEYDRPERKPVPLLLSLDRIRPRFVRSVWSPFLWSERKIMYECVFHLCIRYGYGFPCYTFTSDEANNIIKDNWNEH